MKVELKIEQCHSTAASNTGVCAIVPFSAFLVSPVSLSSALQRNGLSPQAHSPFNAPLRELD